MAFNLLNFQFNRGTGTANASGGGVTSVTHSYKSEDTLETIDGAGYFPPNIDGSTDKIFVEDFLLIEASDDTALVAITSTDPFTYGPNILTGSGTNLTVGETNPGISGEGAHITSNVLHMEIADQTYPGLLSTTAQVIGGVKTFASVAQFPVGLQLTPGYTLNYYKATLFTTTFSQGSTTTPAGNFSVVREGNSVTLMLKNQITFTGDAGGANSCTSDLPLPAEFRPTGIVEIVGFWRNFTGDNVNPPYLYSHVGLIKIDSGGNITIFADNDETFAWPPGKTNIMDACTFCYNIS